MGSGSSHRGSAGKSQAQLSAHRAADGKCVPIRMQQGSAGECGKWHVIPVTRNKQFRILLYSSQRRDYREMGHGPQFVRGLQANSSVSSPLYRYQGDGR